MNTNNELKSFINSFAILNTKFIELEKYLKTLTFFSDIKKHTGIYYSNRVEGKRPKVSMGVDSELKKVYKKDTFSSDPLYSIGVSFDIWEENDMWFFNGDVGMSRLNGFDNTYSMEENYINSFLLLKELEVKVNILIKEFNDLVKSVSKYR